MARSAWSSTVAAVGLAVCFVASVAAAAEPAVTPDHPEKMARGLALFKDHVRATLIQHCVKCHGGQKIKAKLDLTTRPTLLRGGKDGAVIVPGQPAKSLMVKLITHADEPHMPYKADRLPDEAIKQIAAWIENGAPFDKPLLEDKARAAVAGGGAMQVTDEDRDFWSFRPLSRPAPPKVANAAWCRTPIDQFIMAKLEAHGLTPNPSVDRRKLIRRAYLDLLGLPPTPEAIDAFINDPAADAYEKLVDNLLASPHYGERWGRHWLDVARFAESHGFEQDYNREFAFFYRDFVIKALNADMPFDQFVRWQLAGDEFEPDNPLAMMATGFLGAGVFPTQLTEKEFEPARYDELDDMAQTMGTAMLGLTVGCARCHDHKYDPIPTRDYYRLIATFTTTIRSNIDLALDSQATRLAQAKWQSEHAPLVAALKQYENDQLPARFDQWLATRKKGQGPPPTWIVLDLADFKSQGGATLTKLADGSLLASGQNPDFDVYTFVARTHLKGITAIRLEALADPSMVKGGPGRAPNGNMGVGEFTITAEPLAGQGKPVAVKLVNPRATFQQNGGNLSIAASIDGDKKTGWAVDPQFGKDHAAIFDTAEPVGFDGGTKLTFTLTFNVNNKHNIGRPRLSISTVPSPADFHGDAARQNVTEILAIIDKAGGKPTDAQRRELLDWFATTDPQWRQLHDKVQVHLKNKPKLVTTKVMVTSEGFKPIPHHADGRGFPHFYPQTYFLKRGDTSQKQGVATPGFLQVLETGGNTESHWQVDPPAGWRTSYRRRSLANWITDADAGAGKLLARVIVNRLWQHHLGRGIVATPNDFGAQGARPTHPALLEWLAGDLVEHGWRLKRLHKLIMTSAVYMQSAAHDSADVGIDPDNQWWWRRDSHRLEAEVIRDSMLAVSGQLDDTMFGPGTLDEGMKRRSVYFMVKRSKLIPFMQLFDAPEPLAGVGRRPSTTIAPQALLFMNSPYVRQYGASFAARLAPAAQKSAAEAVRRGYLIALGREPSPDELADDLAFLDAQTQSYQADKKPNARDLAMTDFCQALLSLNEFIYVD